MDKEKDEIKAGNLGFDNKVDSTRKRTINPDGSFNIIRKNNFFQELNLYRFTITCNWSVYWSIVLGIYISVNFIFALIYFSIGSDQIVGTFGDKTNQFWQCFFFSLQTFTTVGYGGLHPIGMLTNAIAGFEAFLGLMTFALATGTLYGRFSRPEAKIKFSSNMVLAPFNDGKALMFMICNNTKGNLVEVTAKLNFSWAEIDENGLASRKFEPLSLEYEKINMLALTWTLVHIINEESPVYNFTPEDFLSKDVEVFILITAYDDTFAQIVHSRSSYIGEEIVNNAKFKRAFYTNEDGLTVLDVDSMGAFDLLKG
jgi:inward rectifier potassium channel